MLISKLAVLPYELAIIQGLNFRFVAPTLLSMINEPTAD